MNAPRPDFNREEVRDRKVFEGNFLYEPAFGEFTLALRFFSYEPGDKEKQKLPTNHWVADMRIVRAAPDLSIPFGLPKKDPKTNKKLSGQRISTADRYPVGKDVKLKFPVGRTGTPTDPDRGRRDDQQLADFIAALFRTTRDDKTFDTNAAFDALAQAKKFDDDKLKVELDNTPNESTREVKDPSTGEVLKAVDVVYPRGRFRAISAT